MQSQRSKGLIKPEPADGKTIFVIGPSRLQNQIVARFLEREIGIACQGEDDVSQIPFDGGDGEAPAMVLVDCQGKKPQQLLAELRSFDGNRLSGCPVVLFNVSPNLGIEEDYVQAGVEGFFYDSDTMDIFLKGVEAVFNGEMWLSRRIMMQCIRKGRNRDNFVGNKSALLTPRQTEIIALVAIGAANEEIADKLCISNHTVKVHLYNIFKKINVSNRLQAAFWAAKNL